MNERTCPERNEAHVLDANVVQRENGRACSGAAGLHHELLVRAAAQRRLQDLRPRSRSTAHHPDEDSTAFTSFEAECWWRSRPPVGDFVVAAQRGE
jgi:hypothetical protein